MQNLIKCRNMRLFRLQIRVFSMKKLHLIIFTAVISIIISWFLFFPWNKQVLEDGGTIVYSSLTYKIYVWNKIGGKNTSEIEGVK